jgi:hypothetical protein
MDLGSFVSYACSMCPTQLIRLDILTTTDSVANLLRYYRHPTWTKGQTDRLTEHIAAVPSVSTGGRGGMRGGVVIKPQRRSCFGQYPKRANTSCKTRDTPMTECGGHTVGPLRARLAHYVHRAYLVCTRLCSWQESFVCNVYWPIELIKHVMVRQCNDSSSPPMYLPQHVSVIWPSSSGLQ